MLSSSFALQNNGEVMRLPNVIIREAFFADIDQLVNLLQELFSIEQDFNFNEFLQREGLRMILNNRRNGCILVAEIDQEVIGMCSVQILLSTAEGGKVALCEDMVVKKTYRRQGIGKKLLSSVEKWAKSQGVNRLQLLADQNNTFALKFYEKLHWMPTQLICLQKK